ncbi:hypothetical protein PN441_19510 [Spirulina major CS-329]|uniref:hypothetical protein n=1 Tax=Spirulina TaxID=1154 RepID=UPI00232B9F5F|nr:MULTISPECIES: hypothetical protein [Spirulina]MDB9494643.1 hypothetical protein [Spirulina subsalsa CS-330]MDB9505272.1 hypothetical protein [Spirulina major CS-329]
MVKFQCPGCKRWITPGQNARANCTRTCGSPACQKFRIETNVRGHDYFRQRDKIAQLKAQGVDLVTCQICGDEFQMIHFAHVRTHGFTLSEYKEMYPDAQILNSRSKQYRAQISIAKSKYLTYDGKEPDAKLFEFLAGALLGDGCLSQGKSKINARYSEGAANQPYLEWKYQFLSEYFPCTFSYQEPKPHPKTGKVYPGWWLKTSVHPVLTELRRHWYNPKKVVPMDFIEQYLTEFALTIWFCDDGHLGKHNALLYPMLFSEKEVRFLRYMLLSRFGLTTSLILNSSGQPIITILAESKPKFQDILSQFRIPGMAYKTHG